MPGRPGANVAPVRDPGGKSGRMHGHDWKGPSLHLHRDD